VIWITATEFLRLTVGGMRSLPMWSPLLAPANAKRALDRSRRETFDMSDHPLIAIWEVTRACDLACVHCRACAVTDRHPLELDTNEGFALLDRIAEMGTPIVVLTGGDPAKRPDLVELIAHGAKQGLTMALTPSSTGLVTHHLLARAKRAGLARIAVSVDGATAATHDAFRGVEGSFAHALRIFEDAKAIGLERQINFTLSKRTLSELDDVVQLAERIGAALLSVFLVVPTGRASTELMLEPNEIEDAFLRLQALAKRIPFDIKTTAAPHFRRVTHQAHEKAVGVHRDKDENGNVKGIRGINDGLGFLFVSHVGDVMPSGFLPIPCGNVRREPLSQIYRQSPVFTRLRDASALGGKCGLCPFKLVCGGSRARAWATSGDFMAEDPSCAYVPRGAT
jgi:radical SAM protein